MSGLVEVLWRHRMARPVGDGEAITWCVCLGWSIERGSLHDDEQGWNDHLAAAILAWVHEWLRAVAADEGVRERVADAVFAQYQDDDRTDDRQIGQVALTAFLDHLDHGRAGDAGEGERP